MDANCWAAACKPGTFRYDLGIHTKDGALKMGSDLILNQQVACIPCDEVVGTQLCSEVFGTVNPHFYNHQSCQAATAEEKLAIHVCDECPLTKANAQLIQRDEVDGPLSTSVYDNWIASRSMPAIYGNHFNGWSNVKCRYRCALGYTSENANANAYDDRPCVPCTAEAMFVTSCRADSTLYVDAESISKSGRACGTDGNYHPYRPSCADCSIASLASPYASPRVASDYIWKATAMPVYSRAECMARCDPTRYHTYLVEVLTLDYHPLKDITCLSCGADTSIPCAGKCVVGKYLASNDTCTQCSSEPCDNGHSREECGGSTTQDAQCLPCNSALLFNPLYAPSPSDRINPISLKTEIQNQAHTMTRRWVSGPPGLYHTGTCWLACMNNYMWVDIRTDQPPLKNEVL